MAKRPLKPKPANRTAEQKLNRQFLQRWRSEYLVHNPKRQLRAESGRKVAIRLYGEEVADTYPLVKGKAGKPDELFIYGAIVGETERRMFAEYWPDDVSASQISRLMLNYEPNPNGLRIRINCPGGLVDEGVAIYETLREVAEETPVEAVVMGEAASAATVIMYAADKVKASRMARLFYHPPNVSGLAGDARRIRAAADELDSVEEDLLALYAERRGVDMREPLHADAGDGPGTWYGAADAVEFGLIDEIRGETHEDPEMVDPDETMQDPDKSMEDDPEMQDPDKEMQDPDKSMEGDPEEDLQGEPLSAPRNEGEEETEMNRARANRAFILTGDKRAIRRMKRNQQKPGRLSQTQKQAAADAADLFL